jgi:ferrous iron transport protein B
MRRINVGFVGNPNCGKTTLFNAITGARLKVANYPGVTVEKREGFTQYKDWELKLLDLPGVYSLNTYSLEEEVTKAEILSEEVDIIVNVVDASSLERNLYLTLQLLELGKPVVLALNMMDIVEERGMEIDLHRLPEMLGDIPVVAVSARKRNGLDVLIHAVVHHYMEQESPEMEHYSGEVSDNKKYEFIENVVDEVLFHKTVREARTDKADQILTHRYWGVPIFFAVMALVFFLTFRIGDLMADILNLGLDAFSGFMADFLIAIHIPEWLKSLIVDGIIGGVGGILTFLPNIVILFLALDILEDSGYMARVAYVMDGWMGRIGLSGKAFLPLVLGFGCSVPATMAARTLDNEKDKRRAILLIPFMSCSAKIPIYVLFSSMFFGQWAPLVAFSMYLLGILVGVLVAVVLYLWDKRKISDYSSLLIELPEYKRPNVRTIFIDVWEKIKGYLTKAGTVIFISSIILWFLLNFGPQGAVQEVSESFGAMAGHWLVPILAPAGLGLWQVGVALIAGLAAKEVVVSSILVLFGMGGMDHASSITNLQGQLGALGFGPLNAYSLMVFSLIYTPCMAAVGTMRKETNSTSFTIKAVLFLLILAWLLSALFYQAGTLLF